MARKHRLLAAMAAAALRLLAFPSTATAASVEKSPALETLANVIAAKPSSSPSLLPNCTALPLINTYLSEGQELITSIQKQRSMIEREIAGPARQAQQALEKALTKRRGSADAASTAQNAAAERGDWKSSAELSDKLQAERDAAARAAAAAADAYARRGRLAEVWRALLVAEAEADTATATKLDAAAATAEAAAQSLTREAERARQAADERKVQVSRLRRDAELSAGAAALRQSLTRAHALAEAAASAAAASASDSRRNARSLVGALAARDLVAARAGGVAAEAAALSTAREHSNLAALLGEWEGADALGRAARALEVAHARGEGAGAALGASSAEAERLAREHASQHSERVERQRAAARAAERLLDTSRRALGVEVGEDDEAAE
jgi:hypothetical protein